MPDLVVSGINSGANVGINVIYSGTVAAAIEAAFLGLPAIALSLYLRKEIPADYARTAGYAHADDSQMLEAGLHGGQVVSVNLPPLQPDENPTGVKVVRQCTRGWADTYEERRDPRAGLFLEQQRLHAGQYRGRHRRGRPSGRVYHGDAASV